MGKRLVGASGASESIQVENTQCKRAKNAPFLHSLQTLLTRVSFE